MPAARSQIFWTDRQWLLLTPWDVRCYGWMFGVVTGARCSPLSKGMIFGRRNPHGILKVPYPAFLGEAGEKSEQIVRDPQGSHSSPPTMAM